MVESGIEEELRNNLLTIMDEDKDSRYHSLSRHFISTLKGTNTYMGNKGEKGPRDKVGYVCLYSLAKIEAQIEIEFSSHSTDWTHTVN